MRWLALAVLREGTHLPGRVLHFIASVLFCCTLPVWSADLPEGRGREIVQAKCNACHALEARVGSGYTLQGWSTVLRMMTNHGAPLSAEEIAEITPYLAKSFPEKAKPAGVVLPGPTQVTMKIWQATTPGARPHDALATRDGAFWYTGQMANVLGRVDPATGTIREYPLKTAHSGPHGLMEDGGGNIWYTGNTGALIGKLDPKTGEIKLLTPPTANARPYGMAVNSRGTVFVVEFGTNGIAAVDPGTLAIREYKLPDPASRPRRVTITSDDIVWYADYSRGFLGRLDPASGEVTEWASPSGPRSAPYGISAINDVIWYSESETTPNTVVRFDPGSGKFQSWAIPGGGNIVRNTSVTPDGNFLLANSLVNTLTLVQIQK